MHNSGKICCESDLFPIHFIAQPAEVVQFKIHQLRSYQLSIPVLLETETANMLLKCDNTSDETSQFPSCSCFLTTESFREGKLKNGSVKTENDIKYGFKDSFTFPSSLKFRCMSQILVCSLLHDDKFQQIYLFYFLHICRLSARVKCVSFHQHHILSPYVNHSRSKKCFQSRFHLTQKGAE